MLCQVQKVKKIEHFFKEHFSTTTQVLLSRSPTPSEETPYLYADVPLEMDCVYDQVLCNQDSILLG